MKKTMFLSDLLNEIRKGTQPKEIKLISNGVVQTCVWSKPFRKYEWCDKPVVMAISELAANALVEYEAPVLDEVEKKYLSAVIKPFRGDVLHICKCSRRKGKFENIRIRLVDFESIDLPSFQKGTMYKNMEPHNNYNLRELGI